MRIASETVGAATGADAHVVGISVGGTIGQLLAARHPGRVRSLTTIASTPSARIGRMTAGTTAKMGRLARRLGTPGDPDAAADMMMAFRNEITGSPA